MNKTKINLSDIEKIIPEQCYDNSNKTLKDKYSEWCLKKYKINDKIYVTISIRHPNSEKTIYINTKGEQIIYTIDEQYNQFIIETKYWYGT